eukprot:SAG31_NODE_16107_length_722_cov_1.654896_1_plen_209_part_10
MSALIGAAALGGFLGKDVYAFVSAVISGAAGTYMLPLMEDASVGTELVAQPGQNVIVIGDTDLAEAPSWGPGGFTVGEMGSLSLSYVRLDADVVLTITGGGSLSLANIALPFAVLGTTLASLVGAGSTLSLSAVTVPEYPQLGALRGVGTAVAGGSWVLNPPNLLDALSHFEIRSGPCTVAETAGRCVGRWPGGYLPNESCEITVAGPG